MPSPDMFAMRLSKDLEADVVRAIGRAQAKIGSLDEARATWQAALDSTSAISSLEAAQERATLYIDIAKAQNEAQGPGQAIPPPSERLQSARAVKKESMFGLDFPGMEDRFDPITKKVSLLRRIAQLQAEIGEKPGSDDNFRLAVETAEGIKDPQRKVDVLRRREPYGRTEFAERRPPGVLVHSRFDFLGTSTPLLCWSSLLLGGSHPAQGSAGVPDLLSSTCWR